MADTDKGAPEKQALDTGGQKVSDRNTALRLFIGGVLDMSWQLAIVVLVPIIGGYELDKHFHTSPDLIIIGFVVAMLGTFVVIKRMFLEYSNVSVKQVREDREKKQQK